jgi:hypothetical protein
VVLRTDLRPKPDPAPACQGEARESRHCDKRKFSRYSLGGDGKKFSPGPRRKVMGDDARAVFAAFIAEARDVWREPLETGEKIRRVAPLMERLVSDPDISPLLT